ncbi:MAG: protein kinase [Myxococcales bacterium]|nr:protein kinase [Myxococcales bacterium]
MASLAGTKIGKYDMIEEVGHGGMAVVYRGLDSVLKREVAVKVLHPHLADREESRLRLEREAIAVAKLRHENILEIFDYSGPEAEASYIVTEFIHGVTLKDWVDERLDPRPAVAALIVHRLCLALQHAHRTGIVHRDIKPENLWVEADQNVKVIDFGLARAWDAGSTLGVGVTLDGTLVGTPRYIQPEQVRGDALTPASDVYSLTTVLYELLTGHSVFFDDAPFSVVRERYRDEPVVWIAAHVREPVVPLHRHPAAAALPEALHRLVYRGLAKDPAERFPDARALGNALGEVLHYELGAVLGAIMRVTHPWGGHEDLLLLPGSHRIGRAPHCEIALAGEGIEPEHAVLEWAGPPDMPELHPLHDDERVQVGGQPVRRRLRLPAEAAIELGGYSLQLRMPRV